MPSKPKALPVRAESLVTARAEASRPPEGPWTEAVVAPLDFDGTAALSDAALRAQAREAEAPGARLAACWRLMIRGQALPQSSPGEGIRHLTLINLATQQDIELLEVVLCLDPSSSVRAQAATLLWRVARDRDRVVDLLVSRLQSDTSPDVLLALLTLDPSLPFEKTQGIARSYLGHRSVDVRRAGHGHWLQNGGPMDEQLTGLIWSEPYRDLRAWCLGRWAEGPDHPRMLREVRQHPAATMDVVSALSGARRFFRVKDVSHLLESCTVEAVLGIAGGPFDADERALLVSLTGLTDPDGSTGRWVGPQLWRCLQSAYADGTEVVLTDQERAWAAFLEEEIHAIETRPPSMDEEDSAGVDEEEMYWDHDTEDLRQLLRLLRGETAEGFPARS